MKKLRYLLEAVTLWLFFQIFRMMPVESASAFGGWIGRSIGPRLAASKKAYRNLRPSFAHKSEAELKDIVRDMWDNLGRVMAEYPHLHEIIMNRVELIDEKYIDEIGENNPCVVISSHLANWELGPFYYNYRKKWPLAGVYRAPNNPYVEKLLERCRNPEKRGTYIPKSQQGVRDMMKTLKDGKRLGQLIDQKFNQGIPVEFFGRPAMTSSAFAQLARKFDVPIIALQIERLPNCHFRITFHKPFKTDDPDDAAVVRKVHAMLEEWISKNPGQWLWIHRRWDTASLMNHK